MRNRCRNWLLLLALIGVSLGMLYELSTHVGRGWLRGEAFFDGRPTSYWRQELERWQVRVIIIGGKRGDLGAYTRSSSWFERMRESWFPPPKRDDDPFFPLNTSGPRLLQGGEEAGPVLRKLLDDPSPRVRLFAQIGLKMNPELPDHWDD